MVTRETSSYWLVFFVMAKLKSLSNSHQNHLILVNNLPKPSASLTASTASSPPSPAPARQHSSLLFVLSLWNFRDVIWRGLVGGWGCGGSGWLKKEERK